MKLSDGSDLGISTETIACPGHTLGLCPEGMIWYKVVRVAVTGEFDLRQVRQYWVHAQLPRDAEEVKQHLALVWRKDGRVSWMFLYLSELTPDHLGWFTDQDWENVRAWLSSARMRQVLRDALELCQQQHETNVKAASPVLAVDELTDFPVNLTGCQPRRGLVDLLRIRVGQRQ
jgi:hypothetical protein